MLQSFCFLSHFVFDEGLEKMFCFVLLLFSTLACTSAQGCNTVYTCKEAGTRRYECKDKCACIDVRGRRNLILEVHPGVREVRGVAVHLIVSTSEQVVTLCRPGIIDIKLGGDVPVKCSKYILINK